MIKELQKYFTNKRTRKGGLPCERILGTNTSVNNFAEFWDRNGDDLMLISAVKLHEFESESTFTMDELVTYKKGMADVALFFKKCWDEREMKREETKTVVEVSPSEPLQ